MNFASQSHGQKIETNMVRVFRDSPVFDQYEKWFMVPMPTLAELHVATYEVVDDHMAEGIAEIEGRHPNCVYVY